MSCTEALPQAGAAIPDRVAAAAFRRLLGHLAHRADAQNVDLMGLAGFCRNCLADWVREASADGPGPALDREAAREAVYGMSYAEWKATHQTEATPEQIARMDASVAKNRRKDAPDGSVPAGSVPAGETPAWSKPER